MSSLTQLTVNSREVYGKKLKARRLEGFTPANIVRKGQDSVAIELPTGVLVKILPQVGYTQALELLINEDKITVLVSEVSFAPTKSIPEHVVFTEVKQGEKVTAAVPLTLIGEAEGASKGLLVLQLMYELEVEAPALKIPEQIDVDITPLTEEGDVVRIVDLNLPADITITADPQIPVVKLEMSRSQVSEEAVPEEAGDQEGVEQTDEAKEDQEQKQEED